MDRVRQACRLRHFSPRTEDAYCHWIRHFIVCHGTRHPDQLGEADIVAFLSSLAVVRQVSASTRNQALSSLLFLYGAGLRLTEALGLRVKDVDMDRSQMRTPMHCVTISP